MVTVMRRSFLREEFEADGEVYIATEDGSVGTKGNVMDAIREAASGGRDYLRLWTDSDASCDESSMQQKNRSECYISLEERMACGIGACLACVCKSKEKDAHSNVHNKRICKEGPVFLCRRRWNCNEYESKYCRSRMEESGY